MNFTDFTRVQVYTGTGTELYYLLFTLEQIVQ